MAVSGAAYHPGFTRYIEASQDILWIRDAATLQWVYLTPAFEAIYGLSREDALAGGNYRSWQDLIVAEDRDHAVGAIRWLRNTDFPITGRRPASRCRRPARRRRERVKDAS